MRFTLAISCMLACATPALAQSATTNTRDVYGNLVGNTGVNPGRGSNPAPNNNSNGAVRSTLGPTQPTNPRLNKGASK